MLEARLGEIAELVAAAEASAAAQPAALRARLAEQVAALLAAVPALPEERLAQEAALLIAKADVREELDRLAAHVAAARALLCEGGAVGRRFDFLCQEFNREANTLCSKSADLALDPHRPRAQGGDRAAARAGAEHRIGRGGDGRDQAARHPAGPELAVGRRQDHDHARARRCRSANLALSISVTTRPRRAGEIDGRHYHFIARARFDAMVEAGELLEHAMVFGHCYGTPRAPVVAALAAGSDIISDVDWQGTQQLKERLRDDLVSVFILPPSLAALEERLRQRAQDSAEVVAARMAKSADEMSHWPEYDYVIVNRDARRQRAPGALDPRSPNGRGATARSGFPNSSIACAAGA